MTMPFSAMTRLFTAAIWPARARSFSFLSRQTTFRPLSTHRAPAARPLMPPPITRTSVFTVSAISASGMGAGGVSQLYPFLGERLE